MRRARRALALAALAVLAFVAVPPAIASAATEVCPPALPIAADRAAPRDRGLLWRISRDGRVSWLFGTVHVGKPAWRRFGPRLNEALRGSDVLALEIDPEDPALAAALIDASPPLDLPAPLQSRLAQAFERACLASAALSSLHPVMQATMLTVLEARWLGLDPLYAFEQLLAQHVRGQGRKVVALETPQQQKSALLPSDPADALATMEQSLDQLEDQSGRRALARLIKAWESGDLATLSQYEQWCECTQSEEDRAALRRLNDERNPALAEGIAAQHAAGRRVFAAVGALHMTGPQALPLLLAGKGFKVERIVFARP